jgi:hypothetical protein
VNWRFRVPDGESIEFVDGFFGRQQFVAGKDFGDFCRVAIKVGKGCAIKTGMGLEHGAMEQDDGFGERSWGVAEVEEVAVGP